MAKDPAFLFYSQDWIVGTLGMTFEEKGAYISLLSLMHQKGRMNEKQIKCIIGVLWDEISVKFKQDEDGLFYNERLEYESNKRKSFVESRRQSRIKSSDKPVRIYIVCDVVRNIYKIGSSVNPLRRYNELENQESPAIMSDKAGDRKLKMIWYSDPVERIMETQIHQLFSNKRLHGAWFNLNNSDIQLIKEHIQKCYDERTLHRTENEIENEIEKVNGFKKPTIQEIKEYMAELGKPNEADPFFDHYQSNGWKVSKNPMKDWKAACRNWIRPKPFKAEPVGEKRQTLADLEKYKNL